VRLTLRAVPNVSEGRDRATLVAIGRAFTEGGAAELLDVHADPDHARAVFTLEGEPGRLAEAVLAGAREAVARIDLRDHVGVHPRVGALDVAPVVFRTPAERGPACAEALVLADLLGREGLPVYLYGLLAGGRTRVELRRAGALHGLVPDFGPRELHPTAGAVLVAARPPLVAFNLWLRAGAPARALAARVRETVPGVKALGLDLDEQHATQVSTNVEDVRPGVLREVLDAVGAENVTRAELVGLAPEEAWAGFPEHLYPG